MAAEDRARRRLASERIQIRYRALPGAAFDRDDSAGGLALNFSGEGD